MSINREDINQIVEVYYQPVFKTFYVNSVDEKNLIKPTGVFVSLGITTSPRVLEDIKNVLLEKGYNAVVAEISSRKTPAGRFINTLIKTEGISQYELTEFNDSIMNKEEALKELERLKGLASGNSTENFLVVPRISKLKTLISKLDNTEDGWNFHRIQYDSEIDDFRIYHKFVNYKNSDDVEYRIGIYVCEKI